METFHIVLTAIFVAGTCSNVILILLSYDERIHTVFNLGVGALNLIVFYSVAAYAISTNNWTLYWSIFIINTAVGVINAKHIASTPEFAEYLEEQQTLF